jgi:hypothetical protein
MVVVVALIAIGVAVVPVARLALAANRAGFFEQAKPETYTASRAGNLKAITTAMDLTYESEGQYPDGAKWMDTLFTRMKTDNLTEAQAKEKFRRPGVPTEKFGYALNSEVAGKIRRELKPETVVVFESETTEWNASGDLTKAIKGGLGLTVDGHVVDLGSHQAVSDSGPKG